MARPALAQLPRPSRRRVLFRADSGGGTQGFLAWPSTRRLRYSVGMTITPDVEDAILTIPQRAWEPAYDSEGQARDGAWVAELTGLLNLTGWPGTQIHRFCTWCKLCCRASLGTLDGGSARVIPGCLHR